MDLPVQIIAVEEGKVLRSGLGTGIGSVENPVKPYRKDH
jgi:hypothetical protein